MGAEQLQEPIQTELKWIEGIPEGSFYAPPGYVVIDKDTGEWYRKTTPKEFNTGWQRFSAGGTPGSNVVMGTLITSGLPTIPPPVTSATWLALDPDAGIYYIWIVDKQLWE